MEGGTETKLKKEVDNVNYLIIDTETAGGLENPIVYDLGGIVVNNKGDILHKFSFVISDIFYQRELMNTAYYKEKIPLYERDIFHGRRRVATFEQVYLFIQWLLDKYQIKAVLAYNARFDLNALNNTRRYLNQGEYFFPYALDKQCIMCMAQDTLCKQKAYSKFCHKNGYLTKAGRLRSTAEIVYRYIKMLNDFTESHTGLEDVLIEWEIWKKVVRQHKKMRRHYWDKVPK